MDIPWDDEFDKNDGIAKKASNLAMGMDLALPPGAPTPCPRRQLLSTLAR